jgi:ribosomal protein S18 acetylase RimI-like enzyme
MTQDARNLTFGLHRAGPADAAELALVASATFLETYAGALRGEDIVLHCGRYHAVSNYDQWLSDPESALWLARAEPGGAPVGYMLLSKPDAPARDPRPDDLEIKRLYLLHRVQRLGLGQRLLELALAHAREQGRGRLLLGVYSQNHPALAFYRKVGFEVVGDRTFRVGNSDFYDYILGLQVAP